MAKRAVALTLLVAAVSASSAAAFQIDPPVFPLPKLPYPVPPPDWGKPFGRVARAVNRAHVGVRLIRAKIPEQATIFVARLKHRCGAGGGEGTTQTLRCGYAAVYLPHDCHRATASIVAGHERGHALGLLHEDRR